MSKHSKIIKQIDQIATDANKIIVWTSAFKAIGDLYKDEKHADENLVTLTDARICNHFEKCSCDNPTIKWLNIFEEDIVAFSLIKE